MNVWRAIASAVIEIVLMLTATSGAQAQRSHCHVFSSAAGDGPGAVIP
jgi:hypothetical protein